MKPITREEALQYDPSALQGDITKREKNITIFQQTITAEKDGIIENMRMITVIPPSHPDVLKLKDNIKKKEENIQTFQDAIHAEQTEIDRDRQMIAIIESN